MIKFNFNFCPLSVNQLYVNIPGQKRRFISTKGKQFKAAVEDAVKTEVATNNLLPYLSALLGKRLTVTIKITSPSWVLKDGNTARKKDISNTEKGLQDSIFSAFNSLGCPLDDSQIWKLELLKEVGPVDLTEYTISEYL